MTAEEASIARRTRWDREELDEAGDEVANAGFDLELRVDVGQVTRGLQNVISVATCKFPGRTSGSSSCTNVATRAGVDEVSVVNL